MRATIAQKAISMLLSGVLALCGSVAILGVQALAPKAMGNVAYAKTYKGSDGILTYKHPSGKATVVYKCTSKQKTVEIAGTVTFARDDEGSRTKALAVRGIAAKAFKGTKARTVVIYTTKLTKKGVKNCFKKSKVETVEVPRKVLKKYRKYFKKKNCGADVEVVSNWDYSKAVEKLAMPLK